MGFIIFILALVALAALALFVYACRDEIIGAIQDFLIGLPPAPDPSRFSLDPPDGRVGIAQRRQLEDLRGQAVQDTLVLVTDLDREAEQVSRLMEAIVADYAD